MNQVDSKTHFKNSDLQPSSSENINIIKCQTMEQQDNNDDKSIKSDKDQLSNQEDSNKKKNQSCENYLPMIAIFITAEYSIYIGLTQEDQLYILIIGFINLVTQITQYLLNYPRFTICKNKQYLQITQQIVIIILIVFLSLSLFFLKTQNQTDQANFISLYCLTTMATLYQIQKIYNPIIIRISVIMTLISHFGAIYLTNHLEFNEEIIHLIIIEIGIFLLMYTQSLQFNLQFSKKDDQSSIQHNFPTIIDSEAPLQNLKNFHDNLASPKDGDQFLKQIISSPDNFNDQSNERSLNYIDNQPQNPKVKIKKIKNLKKANEQDNKQQAKLESQESSQSFYLNTITSNPPTSINKCPNYKEDIPDQLSKSQANVSIPNKQRGSKWDKLISQFDTKKTSEKDTSDNQKKLKESQKDKKNDQIIKTKSDDKKRLGFIATEDKLSNQEHSMIFQLPQNLIEIEIKGKNQKQIKAQVTEKIETLVKKFDSLVQYHQLEIRFFQDIVQNIIKTKSRSIMIINDDLTYAYKSNIPETFKLSKIQIPSIKKKSTSRKKGERRTASSQSVKEQETLMSFRPSVVMNNMHDSAIMNSITLKNFVQRIFYHHQHFLKAILQNELYNDLIDKGSRHIDKSSSQKYQKLSENVIFKDLDMKKIKILDNYVKLKAFEADNYQNSYNLNINYIHTLISENQKKKQIVISLETLNKKDWQSEEFSPDKLKVLDESDLQINQ